MRFYPNTRRMRIVASALCLGITAVGLLFVRRHPWFTVLVLINPVIQFANLWTNYWETTETALVQHGMGLRRELPYSDLSYAGPVRGRRLRRWLSASIEVDAHPACLAALRRSRGQVGLAAPLA